MDAIYHEKQEGQLCAQHSLNNLLQGSYFNPVQLAEIAQRLDEVEKEHLTSGSDITKAEYKRIMEQPSTNMDDSGFFSVQVISEALKIWSLDTQPLSSPRMKQAKRNPVHPNQLHKCVVVCGEVIAYIVLQCLEVGNIYEAQKAFICNHELHWLTIRKLGFQWFNLDSLKGEPELISDTYLRLFLAQLETEVTGNLPSCEADELLTLAPYEPEQKPKRNESTKKTEQKIDPEDQYQIELAEAIAASKNPSKNEEIIVDPDELQLAEAIALSLSENTVQSGEESTNKPQ